MNWINIEIKCCHEPKKQKRKMDSITQRILFESGLYPGNPTLPPVNNVGMVYIKEPMLKQAEMDLFDARVALRDLEEAERENKITQDLENKLYATLAALEKKEGEYFTRRYGAGTKGETEQILKGWGDIARNLRSATFSEFMYYRDTFGEMADGYKQSDDTPDVVKENIKLVTNILQTWGNAFKDGHVNDDVIEAAEKASLQNADDAGQMDTDDYDWMVKLRNRAIQVLNEVNSETSLYAALSEADVIPGQEFTESENREYGEEY